MKKIKMLLIAFTAIAATANNASAQVIEEGNIIIDAYYGFPNLYSAVFRTAYANGTLSTNVNVGGFGPVGVRGEYLLTDKFGLGIDIGMNQTTLDFQEATQVYNETTDEYETRVYDYNYSTQKIGVMVTFNYHFIENDNLDFYGMLGAGYGNRSFTFDSTNPDNTNVSIKSAIPVASRLGVGLRYFFTENIGANLGLGFGQGGLINAGLSLKF